MLGTVLPALSTVFVCSVWGHRVALLLSAPARVTRRGESLIICATNLSNLSAVPPREAPMHLYNRPEEPSDRENRIFCVVELQVPI